MKTLAGGTVYDLTIHLVLVTLIQKKGHHQIDDDPAAAGLRSNVSQVGL